MLATQVVHWPGKNMVACDDHASKLRSLGTVLGCSVSCTPVTEEAECGICINESNKRPREVSHESQ